MPEADSKAIASVIGAAGGIGRHTVVTLASRGFTVAALDVDESGLATLARDHPPTSPWEIDDGLWARISLCLCGYRLSRGCALVYRPGGKRP